MAANSIDSYRREIEKKLQAGNATEHTHRSAVEKLIESLGAGLTATNEPKRVECGAPDFVISRKAPHGPITVGYIEAKDIGKPLGEIERSDQMKRYLPVLPNLILTDYLEFRWYVDGEPRLTARITHAGKGGMLVPDEDGAKAVFGLLAGFLSHEAEPIASAKELALRMARLTHFIRDMIVAAFEKNAASAPLLDLRQAFERALIPELPVPQFADMFAQTLAYGLFAARVNHRGPRGSFRRLGAAAEIPKTNPFLRKLFETITGADLNDEPFAGFVGDLAQLLADTEMGAVLADFGKRTARQDPVLHFYETFLAAYDPNLRETRGVYYTPEPVVSYLVRSVDYLLTSRFGCLNGLAETATVGYSGTGVPPVQSHGQGAHATSPRVLILDPACGTGTFLYAVIDHIRADFMRQGNAGMWSGYVRDHLLSRLFGFELLMAPYAVAHFKLGMQLAGHDLTPSQREKWGYDFAGGDRLRVYLTNTLDEAERRAQLEFGFLRTLTDEANAAVEIKRTLPILAVIGNPPYSGHSANRSWEIKQGKKVPTFIGGLVRDYYSVDGKPLGEKNPKWLQDDYVKFIRWGQWRIERAGAGILAFISNNGYLDNPTFRGMRQSLVSLFSEIYILNLHGNSKKKEKCPDGSPDENVFDIQQGVALGVFVKPPNKTGPARVFHADLWGLRGAKYEYLFDANLETTRWTHLCPQSPAYLFIPQDSGLSAEYEQGWKITDAMPVNSLGIATARDHLAVRWSKSEMIDLARDFAALPAEEARAKYDLGPDVRDWKVSLAQKDLRDNSAEDSFIKEILYRPFDSRFTHYTGRTRGFHCMPRRGVMNHLLAGKNIAICTTRSTEIGRGWEHVLCSRDLIQLHTVSLKEVNYLFPLYLHSFNSPTDGQKQLPEPDAAFKGMRVNLNPKLTGELQKRLGLSFVPDGKGDLKRTFGPEDVFNYIYAIFHSPTYRARYAEFLKSDFPRVPLTSDRNLFRVLCEKGAELVALHLLESPKLEKLIARYPVKGSNIVDKGVPKYLAPGEPEPGTGKPLKEGRVYINRGTGVPPAAPERQRGEPVKSHGQDAHATAAQYFEGVPPEVWNFHIGGYQVCEKWLKDRRGRALTHEDLQHYRKVITALQETIRLMAEIDAAIPRWPIE